MLRSAASKVLWVGRATVFLVGLAVIVALTVGVVSQASAQNNRPAQNVFLLGATNTVNAMSSLVGSVSDSAMLLVENNGGPALDLRVTQGPPMTVNSPGKVANLHADQLDGKSQEDFYAAGSKVADSNKLDGKGSTEFAPAGLFGQAVSPTVGEGGGECILGEVRLFAGVRMDGGWERAEGQLLWINENTALYSLLGTNYGGDGRTNFALPDLRGAEPKGAGPQAPAYAICVQGIFPG